MPCHCTCGRIIDCDRITCDICEDEADTTSTGKGDQHGTSDD